MSNINTTIIPKIGYATRGVESYIMVSDSTIPTVMTYLGECFISLQPVTAPSLRESPLYPSGYNPKFCITFQRQSDPHIMEMYDGNVIVGPRMDSSGRPMIDGLYFGFEVYRSLETFDKLYTPITPVR